MKKNAFTLMEVLIVLVFIGFISMLMLSVANNQITKTNILAKKSYVTANAIIQDLINNQEYYPAKSSDSDPAAGFKDTSQVTMQDTGTTTSGNYKFTNLFTNKLASGSDQTKRVEFGPRNNSQINTTSNFTYTYGNDGTVWMVENTNFANGTALIYVDTNNKNSEAQSCIWDSCSCREPDVFAYIVTYNGKLKPSDPYLKALIKSSDVKVNDFLQENKCEE